MGSRAQLQEKLEALLGTRYVYFQPPESVRLNYPCIIYSRTDLDTLFADDSPYRHKFRYSLNLIDPDPDSELLDKLAQLPMCVFERSYTADNLNHDVFNVYY
jgi:hypothetical protein